jgi:hypothetical protein
VSPLTDEDLDRLADYTAGLLDPAEAAEVDRLIATDGGWARAHSALAAARPLLDRALGDLPAEPLPADVAARIERALEREGTGTRSNVIDLGKARRWRRAALATTAVAASVAACVGGVTLLSRQQTISGSTNTSAGDAKAVAPREAQGFAAGPPTRASGTDYTHDTLGRPAAALSGRAPDAAGAPEPSDVPAPASAGGQAAAGTGPGVPAELSRLLDPAQLRTCLDAIAEAEGGHAVAVDYARYRGTPALIVTLAGGRVRAVAARPSCGLPGSGAGIIDTAP